MRLTKWEALLSGIVLAACLSTIAIGGPWRWLALPCLAVLGAIAFAALSRLKVTLLRNRDDYRHLVDIPAQATWICDADGRFLVVSERWVEWTGTDASDWNKVIHPDDLRSLNRAWGAMLASNASYDLEIRVRLRSGEYRWMRTRAFPQRDSKGQVTRWLGQTEDIHDRRLAEEQLRQTAGLLEMIGASTDSIIWAKDREGRMLYVNPALERVAGVLLGDVAGKLDVEWNPNQAEAMAFREADRHVLESGRPDDREESFTGKGGQRRFYRSIRSPLRDRAGAIIGSVGIATDITERREADEREKLLARELDHRAKNLLAVVQSVVSLTRATNLSEFKTAIEGRIHALGRAHSMLAASRWEGADLQRVLMEELAPYRHADQSRVQLVGHPLLLKPAAAQSLALVFHELATNAVKYGALSVPEGELRVTWNVEPHVGRGPMLRIRWEEQGGPPVKPRTSASRSGFGSKLIRSSIERQLAGSLNVDWAETGLVVAMDVILDRALHEAGGKGELAPFTQPQASSLLQAAVEVEGTGNVASG